MGLKVMNRAPIWVESYEPVIYLVWNLRIVSLFGSKGMNRACIGFQRYE